MNVKKERSVPLSFITLHSFSNPTKGPDCVVVSLVGGWNTSVVN